MTRENYLEKIAPNWMCDERGWDFSICTAMKNNGWKSLAPALSRSRNIGERQGTHVKPKDHKKFFDGHVASIVSGAKDWKIESS